MEEKARETTRRRLQYERCTRLHILEWRSFSLLESAERPPQMSFTETLSTSDPLIFSKACTAF
ncbi:hypothetical protein EYF80_006669 [Liparis tanakae]|uniref:Uncharacterized protein n=1 Tax=Liparis tanakae TaxID=230148 RepID=A0A4Z2J0I7_9TELE|nr:hypothetical protein EYF80_006669 [Liparis tanakae]